VPAWLLRATLGELATAVLDDDYVIPRRLLSAGFEFAETDLAALLARTVT
jgi:NAD dependent epimerase/dehydratase family enzyme